MNSAHAVLRNWNILQIILNFVTDDCWTWTRERNLVAVALVCRVLSDAALNVLWREINLTKINSLFPVDVIGGDPRDRKSLTHIPATPQDWERFDAYASRIRELRASPSPDDLFFMSARTRYPTSHRHHVFPNLTRLQWSSTPSRFLDAIPLMSPTLTEVRLTIDVRANGLEFEENEFDCVAANVFLSLGDTCPCLRKLEYTHYSTPINRSKIVEISIVSLVLRCRQLEDVHLPVGRDILRALGSLPRLSTLRLDYVIWEDGSQLCLPTEVELIKAADIFPVLNDLTIQGSHTVSSLTECFRDSGCFPRESFTMREISECDEWSTLAIAEFFRGILRPERSEGLMVFCIKRSIPFTYAVGHDSWRALQCLSSIPNIRTLTLDGLFLDISDTVLKEISQIWPALRSLSLNVPYARGYQSQITFQDLANLSILQNLENLSLMLAPDSTISKSMLSPSIWSKSRLQYLTIQGPFPHITLCEATMFFILHFPRLKRIETSLDQDEEEEGWMYELRVLLDGVRLTMKNLDSVRRSLGPGTGVEQEDGED